MGRLNVEKYLRKHYGVDIDELSFTVADQVYTRAGLSGRNGRKAIDTFLQKELGMHKLTLFHMIQDYLLIHRAYKEMEAAKNDFKE